MHEVRVHAPCTYREERDDDGTKESGRERERERERDCASVL